PEPPAASDGHSARERIAPIRGRSPRARRAGGPERKNPSTPWRPCVARGGEAAGTTPPPDVAKSTLAARLLAGLSGSLATLVARVLLVPVYLRLLGAESYGLIGFYATINGIGALLDAGLSTAINRELARLSAMKGQEQEARDVLRTLELGY